MDGPFEVSIIIYFCTLGMISSENEKDFIQTIMHFSIFISKYRG